MLYFPGHNRFDVPQNLLEEYSIFCCAQSIAENKAKKIIRFDGELWIVTGAFYQYHKCQKLRLQRVVESNLHFGPVYTYNQKSNMRDPTKEAMTYDYILIRCRGKKFVVLSDEIELIPSNNPIVNGQQLDLFEDVA